jgi:hypothetical protein
VKGSDNHHEQFELAHSDHDRDPSGKWIVRVTVKDLVKRAIIPLETTFVLQ